MARQRIGTLTPLDEAIGLIAAHVRPASELMRDGFIAALGAVFPTDVVVPRDVPPVPTAILDGWAIRAEETLGASPYSPAPLATAPIEVEAGAPLPPGRDAILPFDVVLGAGAAAMATQPAAVGQGTTPAGADARAGDILFRAGDTIDERAASAMLGVGFQNSDFAARIPQVAHVAIKAEAPATIACLLARREHWWEFIAPPAETPDALFSRLSAQDQDADAYILVGGTGEGANDWTVKTLAACGEVLFHGAALDPGRSCAFAMVGNRPVLAVPRRPQAALAVGLTLKAALLRRLLGAPEVPEPSRAGALKRKVTAAPGLTRLVYVRWEGEAVVPLGGADLPLALFARAEGYVLVPPTSEGFPEGARVEVRPLRV